ncbi:hypothetical protein TGAM01_v205256 [Trichoderma gamsii]|uniref:Uncharacterized protein n=1 Tax=Trichoderma gamsii TaxID=398673 RepID=A0A2P4ZNE6_9HYPO|nr:hypothetical protein TGAM01_v205256 [Trichoderma gamsii]PON25819.1 hypothetical protein TGAM01_v205256 [Trichoderma gamsii]
MKTGGLPSNEQHLGYQILSLIRLKETHNKYSSDYSVLHTTHYFLLVHLLCSLSLAVLVFCTAPSLRMAIHYTPHYPTARSAKQGTASLAAVQLP